MMSDYATIARPYAEAVFQLAKENGEIEKWSNMLGLLSMIAQDDQIMPLLDNPRIEKNKLYQLVLDITGENLDASGQNLVHYLSDNRRLPILPALASQFESHKADELGYIKVYLTSCYALKPQQKQDLTEKLKERFNKEIELEVTLDRTLIGGWLIRSQDKVIDLSVRGRLSQLAANIL